MGLWPEAKKRRPESNIHPEPNMSAAARLISLPPRSRSLAIPSRRTSGMPSVWHSTGILFDTENRTLAGLSSALRHGGGRHAFTAQRRMTAQSSSSIAESGCAADCPASHRGRLENPSPSSAIFRMYPDSRGIPPARRVSSATTSASTSSSRIIAGLGAADHTGRSDRRLIAGDFSPRRASRGRGGDGDVLGDPTHALYLRHAAQQRVGEVLTLHADVGDGLYLEKRAARKRTDRVQTVTE